MQVDSDSRRGPVPDDDAGMSAILAMVRAQTGVDFARYRQATVLRRMQGRMRTVGASSAGEYLLRLGEDPAEAQHLLARIAIKVSRFYRHAPTFDLLRHQVLPELVHMANGEPLAVWSAGCGQGEEAHTLAMLLEEAGCAGRVIASDIDDAAMADGRQAEYPTASLGELPADLRARFVYPVAATRCPRVRVCASVAARVEWLRHDLTAGAPLAGAPRFHLIVCRNVLIYLQRDLQGAVVSRLRHALRDGGLLCLGEAEWPTADGAERLAPVAPRMRVFRVAPPPPPEPGL